MRAVEGLGAARAADQQQQARERDSAAQRWAGERAQLLATVRAREEEAMMAARTWQQEREDVYREMTTLRDQLQRAEQARAQDQQHSQQRALRTL